MILLFRRSTSIFEFTKDLIFDSFSCKAHFIYSLNYEIYFSIRNSRHTKPPYFCHVTLICSIRKPFKYEVISQQKWPSNYEADVSELYWRARKVAIGVLGFYKELFFLTIRDLENNKFIIA